MSGDATPIRDEAQEWQALGERLRDSREYLGLSQQEVAERLGISRPAVTHMEAGKRKVSTLELRRLAALYRRPYEWLIGEGSDPGVPQDEFAQTLYRTTRELSDRDREQLLRFAEFLREADGPPSPP